MPLYRDLDVYRRSRALARGIRAGVRGWESFDRWSVGIQLVRSADSVGANLAEGYGRGTPADRRRFVLNARGSAFEVEHWLEVASERGLGTPPNALDEARQVSRMLTGLHRGISASLTPDT